MRQSQLLTKAVKEAPAKEESISARLLIRGGFIDKLAAGLFNFLPLGWRVHQKIEQIIREEMNGLGGEELYLVALHPRGYWEKTKRWQIPEIFKVRSQSGREFALSWTHEEIITPVAQKFIFSYKDLPKYLYQFQVKMRDELRVKAGLLRTKEFIMKDLYSFHSNEKDLDDYYEKVKKSYFRIFERVGLKKSTHLTYASGGTFSPFSHEFQAVTPAGEDTIFVCPKCRLAINREIKDKISKCPNCKGKNFRQERSIEVGNIFKLGTKYSEAFEFSFQNKKGEFRPVIMGCYGIGLGRLMGAIAEICCDEKGIIWPEEIAPFRVHLLSFAAKDKKKQTKVQKTAEDVYGNLIQNGVEVLFDDREDKTAGEKMMEADLLGIPWRVIVSEKTIEKGNVEIKRRESKGAELVRPDKLLGSVR
ncbi:MAG: prolyl-tRNA synthetase [Candidatus Portnoybacteria bacterium CG09_land_8_20_14_0_10_44_13]|uniref:Proline--tRNA ligase n=1 Tax=Candidatus Portnoybacteria bacterium CG09_land_8_20_14_0_10_44_13 TaxID=1974811 RepID=A0A2H0WW29_9BACT|nr:MAG: prolyl-tRNA synthetase [Candidatus Portnoybacteria bacterium CG09_land_8_20_14_0_10_44_13]